MSYKNQLLFHFQKTQTLTNHKPLTLTLTISKLLEKCVKIKLAEFLTKNNFFNKNRFGFRNNLSTYDTLYYSTIIIYDLLE